MHSIGFHFQLTPTCLGPKTWLLLDICASMSHKSNIELQLKMKLLKEVIHNHKAAAIEHWKNEWLIVSNCPHRGRINTNPSSFHEIFFWERFFSF